MSRSLEAKTVVITGAGRGIGRAVALYLAGQGANVVINDLDEELAQEVAVEIIDAGGSALAFAGSVACWDFAEQLIGVGVDVYGCLDGLINNAGLHYSRLPWEETEESVKSLMDVNVLGVMHCGIHALKQFVTQGNGSLINLTSGAHLGIASQSAYAASKGATASLTYGWAIDALPYGVRVNAVAPLAKTRMTDNLPGFTGTEVQSAESLAPLFGYLLSDSSSHVTGQVIRFNGYDLSLISPPGLADEQLRRDNWSEADISSAFDVTLNARLHPVGLLAANYQPPGGR